MIENVEKQQLRDGSGMWWEWEKKERLKWYEKWRRETQDSVDDVDDIVNVLKWKKLNEGHKRQGMDNHFTTTPQMKQIKG